MMSFKVVFTVTNASGSFSLHKLMSALLSGAAFLPLTHDDVGAPFDDHLSEVILVKARHVQSDAHQHQQPYAHPDLLPRAADARLQEGRFTCFQIQVGPELYISVN